MPIKRYAARSLLEHGEGEVVLYSDHRKEVEGRKASFDRKIAQLTAERDELKAELARQLPHRVQLHSDFLGAIDLLKEAEASRDANAVRIAQLEAELPNDIRENGWAVAVHNDYRLDGETYTFWLFTKGGRAVKGEGRTDAEALNQIRVALGSLSPATAPAHCTECSHYDTSSETGCNAVPGVDRCPKQSKRQAVPSASKPADPYSGKLGDINLRMLAGQMHQALGLLKRQGCYHPAMDMMREEGFKHGLNLPGEGSDA